MQGWSLGESGEIVNCNHPNTFWEFNGYLVQPNRRACNQGSFKGICFTLFQIKNISPKYGKLEKNKFEEISMYICEESKIPKGNHYWLVLLWGRTHSVLPIQDKGCWIWFDIWYTYVRGGFWKKTYFIDFIIYHHIKRRTQMNVVLVLHILAVLFLCKYDTHSEWGNSQYSLKPIGDIPNHI